MAVSRRVRDLSGEQRRALEMLAGSPLGYTEAIMLTHGFTVETLRRLVLDGLATASPGTAHAGGRPLTVTWLMITDLGRQALAGAQQPKGARFPPLPPGRGLSRVALASTRAQ
jgi:hypothetical protein